MHYACTLVLRTKGIGNTSHALAEKQDVRSKVLSVEPQHTQEPETSQLRELQVLLPSAISFSDKNVQFQKYYSLCLQSSRTVAHYILLFVEFLMLEFFV